jgi:putative acetyltransferase
MQALSIRPYEKTDAKAAAALFYASVHQGAQGHYSPAQRQAWAAHVPTTSNWHRRLAAQITYMAVQGNTLAGFMTLAPDGYIDLAFVAPDLIGKGVGKRLYDVIEATATDMRLPRLHTQASHMARVFFARQGWVVLAEQSVLRNNAELPNFIMEKSLNMLTN